MKYLLLAVIIGAGLWTFTECMEIAADTEQSELSLWITMFWHPILAVGFWGLHKSQSSKKNSLSLIGVSIMIYSLILIAPGALVILYTPVESFDELLAYDHFFQALGLIFLAGVFLFGIAINRAKYYPRYVGFTMIILVLLILLQRFLNMSENVLHLTFILLNILLLRMAVYAMNHRAAPVVRLA
jgi:hypothetical protein